MWHAWQMCEYAQFIQKYAPWFKQWCYPLTYKYGAKMHRKQLFFMFCIDHFFSTPLNTLCVNKPYVFMYSILRHLVQPFAAQNSRLMHHCEACALVLNFLPHYCLLMKNTLQATNNTNDLPHTIVNINKLCYKYTLPHSTEMLNNGHCF